MRRRRSTDLMKMRLAATGGLRKLDDAGWYRRCATRLDKWWIRRMTQARRLKVETGGIDWSLRLTADERLAPLLCSSPSVLCLVGCPLGTVVQVMVDLDQVVAGMDVDVAAGTKSQKYASRTNGIARVAALRIGGAVQNCCRPQSRRRLRYWRQWCPKFDEERADGCTKVWMESERLLDKSDEDPADGCTKWERRRDDVLTMIM